MNLLLQVIVILPWLILAVVPPMLLVRRLRLSRFAVPAAEDAPFVSVIVPARDEAVNISACVATLLNSVYVNREIIVVDDGSTDGTGDIVRILSEHADGSVKLVQGKPVPDGWIGKTWACWQGYEQAKGEVLLFTDADTRHDDQLVGHAVGALRARGAGLVSLLPRQLMIGFWERLILPHIFTLISLRYHDLERISRTRRPQDVLANGQFMMFTREAYEAIDGHRGVRMNVVEDQRLAMRIVESGRGLLLAHAEDLMETRMYRSLAGIVEGWSKNLALGSRQATAGPLAFVVPWLIVLFIAVIWIAPPVVLIVSLNNVLAPGLQPWSLTATALSLLFWLMMVGGMKVPLPYALGYPAAAIIVALIMARSAMRGSKVEWKGREYDVAANDQGGETPPEV